MVTFTPPVNYTKNVELGEADRQGSEARLYGSFLTYVGSSYFVTDYVSYVIPDEDFPGGGGVYSISRVQSCLPAKTLRLLRNGIARSSEPSNAPKVISRKVVKIMIMGNFKHAMRCWRVECREEWTALDNVSGYVLSIVSNNLCTDLSIGVDRERWPDAPHHPNQPPEPITPEPIVSPAHNSHLPVG